jgi:hypothetical protein
LDWPFLTVGEWGTVAGGISGAMLILWLMGLALKHLSATIDMGADE